MRVKVTMQDGDPCKTRVVDASTGEGIDGVAALWIEQRGNDQPRLLLEFCHFDLEVDLDAEESADTCEDGDGPRTFEIRWPDRKTSDETIGGVATRPHPE